MKNKWHLDIRFCDKETYPYRAYAVHSSGQAELEGRYFAVLFAKDAGESLVHMLNMTDPNCQRPHVAKVIGSKVEELQ